MFVVVCCSWMVGKVVVPDDRLSFAFAVLHTVFYSIWVPIRHRHVQYTNVNIRFLKRLALSEQQFGVRIVLCSQVIGLRAINSSLYSRT